jgi:hypothetical protein
VIAKAINAAASMFRMVSPLLHLRDFHRQLVTPEAYSAFTFDQRSVRPMLALRP